MCSILGMYRGKEMPSSCAIYRQEQVLTSYWALSTSALLPVQKGGWEGVGNPECQALGATCLKTLLLSTAPSPVLEARVMAQLSLDIISLRIR